MNSAWETPDLAAFGHSIPHLNFSFQLQSNQFQPHRNSYQEVIWPAMASKIPEKCSRAKIQISEFIILCLGTNVIIIIVIINLFILFLRSRLECNNDVKYKMFSIFILLINYIIIIHNTYYCSCLQFILCSTSRF